MLREWKGAGRDWHEQGDGLVMERIYLSSPDVTRADERPSSGL